MIAEGDNLSDAGKSLILLALTRKMSFESKIIDESRQGEVYAELNVPSGKKKLYLESYGCAMNFSDSEIVASILTSGGYATTLLEAEADVILLNTCAIRENAEQKVRQRLTEFKIRKKLQPGLIIGVLGCMAERLKGKLLEEEKLVDIVAGPDSYRDLPRLIETVEGGQKAVNVLLSRDETYGDISPVRLGSNGVSAFISITRGCDNMCSFCVVPFTRGRERSREPGTIINEAKELFENGYREVTLLGQNVDSYIWSGGGLKKEILTVEQQQSSVSFAQLLEMVADISPELRVRFSTSNPRDMTDDVLHIIATKDNICKYIHLPVQSGSSTVLERMNRGYTREDYMERIESIRRIIPGCTISTDIITGFCGETETDHQETISLMQWAGYQFAYMFKYSERPKTLAERQYKDDIPEEIKSRRLAEVVKVQLELSRQNTLKQNNKIHRVLVEGFSKKSNDFLMGRNAGNTVVVFPKGNHKPGDYVNVYAEKCTSATLIGRVID
jgi:tRNA-2-methylthio-N6-dimethylallyladenosine synthase